MRRANSFARQGYHWHRFYASYRVTFIALGHGPDAAPLAAGLKSAARPERTLSRSSCCPSYLVGPSDPKAAVIAFTALRSRRVPVLRAVKGIPDLVQDLPVLVYGRGEDEEPFQEETNVRRLNFRGGLITLATRVAPGQQLILINPATEEDQRCRVFVPT